MRRPLLIFFVAAAIVIPTVIGGMAVAGTATAIPTKPVTITSVKCAGGQDYCYKPAPLTVKRNTKVVWKNASDAPHTVSRCNKANCGVTGGTGKDKLRSPTIDPGRTFAFTFRHAGTYRYYCEFHGYIGMHGTITVK